jgi:hypothetical protein
MLFAIANEAVSRQRIEPLIMKWLFVGAASGAAGLLAAWLVVRALVDSTLPFSIELSMVLGAFVVFWLMAGLVMARRVGLKGPMVWSAILGIVSLAAGLTSIVLWSISYDGRILDLGPLFGRYDLLQHIMVIGTLEELERWPSAAPLPCLLSRDGTLALMYSESIASRTSDVRVGYVGFQYSRVGLYEGSNQETLLYQYSTWAIPWWFPTLSTLAVGCVCVICGPYRHWNRIKTHLCLTCGYDLRGTPGGRCPECGSYASLRADG